MDLKIINGIRSLAIDMINEAGSGHPGVCLSAAPTLYTLFANHLNFNKDDGTWINRDRFVLSAGHASALLYSLLFYSGYQIDIDDLKKFRRKNGKLPGHPELNQKLGIEMTTGPLGEGFASAVGMAIAEEYERNLIGKEIINHFTYVFASDGDLMEGISYEAASLAGTLKLNKLIVLYESNNVTLDGKTKGVFEEDVIKRFEAMGWHTEVVSNGEDYTSIDNAITKAKTVLDKPSLIEIKTILGIGTKKAGTCEVHSGVLSEADMALVKEKMNITRVPFHVSKDAVITYRDKVDQRTSAVYNEWVNSFNAVYEGNPEKKKLLLELEDGNIKLNLKNLKINFSDNMKEDMRITNSHLMNVISNLMPLFIGGCSDVSRSTMAYIENGKDFKINSNKGKNIHFGVRERAMGAILNGLALSGIRPFGSTFLAFSDYIKPSIRLTSMMNLPVTYIFTHDSIKIGSDGPTHQPVEQLSSLRTIPNMTVFRPADVNELVGSWDYIINKKIPATLIIPKEEKGLIPGSSIEGALKGAYIIKKEMGRLSGIIISTGSELETAIEISEELSLKGIMTRVISMPSIEIFNKQPEEYKESLFPIGSKIIVIEASNDPTWNEFIYNKKYFLNINTYGISASKTEILENLGYDFNSLLEKTEKLLK